VGFNIVNSTFFVAVTDAGRSPPLLQLTWLTDTPVWVDQWPLSYEKLSHLNELVDDQLAKGHLEKSVSPWNTPVFVIPKKSGKWRLLHDLRAINVVMESMGALQPGMPTPTMLPENWEIIIIDLKDCFFTIPLHPQDRAKFAFSVPSLNKQEPYKRYQWTVLPQRMKNSPTICQYYVAWALTPVRQAHPEWIIYHYMNDILVASESFVFRDTINYLSQQLATAGLVVAPEKIQTAPVYKYLGLSITDSIVQPQKLRLTTNVVTLHDVQHLVRDLQWLRPYCGISNEDLSPFLQLL